MAKRGVPFSRVWLHPGEDDSDVAKEARLKAEEESKKRLEAVAGAGTSPEATKRVLLPNQTVKQRKRIIMSEQRLATTYQCFSKGNYVIQVTVHEARDLQPRDRDGTSDPYVEVKAHNKFQQRTKTRQSTLNCIWDELLVFDKIEVDEPQEMERGKIKVSVMDKDSIGSDVEIGACDIDIGYVYRQPKHLICHRWIPLVDGSSYSASIQGWLKLSCAIMGPGDPQQIDVAPMRDSVRDEGNGYFLWKTPQPIKNVTLYLLRVNIARAEHLPQMDFSFTTKPKDSVDAYVRVSFAGISNRKTPVVSSCNPNWNVTITIPVLYPSIQTDNISIYLMDHDTTSEDDVVACVSPSVSFRGLHHHTVKPKKDAPFALSWINLYGAPPDRTLTLQGALDKMAALARAGGARPEDPHEVMAERMNEGHVPGSYYRGRLLIRAYIEGPFDREKVSEADLENAPFYSIKDADRPPADVPYVLRFDLFESAFLGGRADSVCVEVSCGPFSEFSRPAPVRGGRAEWGSFVRRRLDFPEEVDEIPDVFVSVYHCAMDGTLGPRIAFTRLKAREFFLGRGGSAQGSAGRNPLRALFLGSNATEQLDEGGRPQGTWQPLRRDSYSGGIADEEWPGFLHFAVSLARADGPDGGGLEESDAASMYSQATRKLEVMPEWRPTIDLQSALELPALLPPGQAKLYREGRKMASIAQVSRSQYDVIVHMYGASRLDSADENGLADPYAEVVIGDVSNTTHAVGNTLYPAWNKELRFTLELPDLDRLPPTSTSQLVQAPLWPLGCIKIWDKDKLARDQFMGHCFFPLRPTGTPDPPLPEAFPLYHDNPSTIHGQVYATVVVTKSGVPLTLQPKFPAESLRPCRLTLDLLGLRGMPVLTTAITRAMGAIVPQTFLIDVKLGEYSTFVEWPPAGAPGGALARRGQGPAGFNVYNRLLVVDQERNVDAPNMFSTLTMDVLLPPYPPIAGALVLRVKSVRADIRTTVGQVTIPLMGLFAHALQSPPVDPAVLAVAALPPPGSADPLGTSTYPGIYDSVASNAPSNVMGDAFFGARPAPASPVQLVINSSAFLPSPNAGAAGPSGARTPLIPAGAPSSSAYAPVAEPASPEQPTQRGLGKLGLSKLLRRTDAIAAALPSIPGTTAHPAEYSSRVVGGSGLFAIGASQPSAAEMIHPKRTASGAWIDWDEYDLEFLRLRPLFDCELEVYIADVPFDTFNLRKGSSRFRIPFLKATDMSEELGRIKGRLQLQLLAPGAAAAAAVQQAAAAAGKAAVVTPSSLPKDLIAVERDSPYASRAAPDPRQGLLAALKERVVVRVYVLRGLNLPPRDLDGTSDPYLVFSLGEQKSRRKEARKSRTLQPMFYEFFETQTTLPGSSLLKVEVWDYDTAQKDDFIGETVIDLENRWYSRTWRYQLCHDPSADAAAGAAAGPAGAAPRSRPTRAPVERRTLFDPARKSAMGKLEMIVEILTVEEASRIPAERVISPSNEFELRVVVWNARKMAIKDSVTQMNDLSITGALEAGNGFEPQLQETDTHLRARDGKGSFNWRMVYSLQLPIASPVFKLQAWDVDVVGRDAIGEVIIDLSPLCRDALRYRKELIQNGECCSMVRRWVPVYHPTKPGESQGEIEVQLDLWPKEVAARRAAGNKRDEPNRYPVLPPPEREKLQFLRPDLMLQQVLGPDMCRKFGAVVCVGAFVVCLCFMLPMIFSDLIVAFIRPH